MTAWPADGAAPAAPPAAVTASRHLTSPTGARREVLVLLAGLVGVALRVGVLASADGPGSTGVLVLAGQHLIGLATAAVGYVLLVRWGVARWLAALAVVPVLWDVRQLGGEHWAPGDPLFLLLASAALLALAWRARPGSLQLGAAVVLVLGALLLEVAGVGQPGAGAPWPGSTPFTTTSDGWVATYQRYGHVPGALLLTALVLAVLGAAGAGRAWSSRLRTVCAMTVAVPGVAVVAGLLRGDPWWDERSLTIGLLPVAGALGLTALLRGRRSAAASRAQHDEVDDTALAAVRERHGDLRLAPVVVVIAAYNEAAGLPRVLSTLPAQVCGLDVDVVVVDDGSSDGTAEAVREHGRAYVVPCARNRGQGAALRLGYRLARESGARFLITTDADGQYDPADFPVVLAPVLEGAADFVTGSRRLGRQHTRDRFRRAGVHVFAWAVRALTGERVTDTSFGLRAMRADVTAAVTLNQPQYQSSELLIGVHSHGFRIAEVPGTMHVRSAGSTKKGKNLVYGTRYARVVLGTWWREGCPAPAQERAAALAPRPAASRATAPAGARTPEVPGPGSR